MSRPAGRAAAGGAAQRPAQRGPFGAACSGQQSDPVAPSFSDGARPRYTLQSKHSPNTKGGKALPRHPQHYQDALIIPQDPEHYIKKRVSTPLRRSRSAFRRKAMTCSPSRSRGATPAATAASSRRSCAESACVGRVGALEARKRGCFRAFWRVFPLQPQFRIPEAYNKSSGCFWAA